MDGCENCQDKFGADSITGDFCAARDIRQRFAVTGG